jgi:hypothetical protein
MTNTRPLRRCSSNKRPGPMLENDDLARDRDALIEEIKQLRAAVNIYREVARLAAERVDAA